MAKGKILIMDDEILVRTVATKMLEFLGYQVQTVPNGESALALYHAHLTADQPFDAVILDWMVPDGMDGFKTMRRLRDMDPEAKGILSSGYPDQDEAARTVAGFSGVIGKPYELKTLKETLEKVLGKSPAAA